MDSAARGEAEVGKTVDEWLVVDDAGQQLRVGMVGERTIVGSSASFTEAADGASEVVIVGPADAAGRRRIGIHHRRSRA